MTIDFFIRGQFAPNFFNLFLPTTLSKTPLKRFSHILGFDVW